MAWPRPQPAPSVMSWSEPCRPTLDEHPPPDTKRIQLVWPAPPSRTPLPPDSPPPPVEAAVPLGQRTAVDHREAHDLVREGHSREVAVPDLAARTEFTGAALAPAPPVTTAIHSDVHTL